MPASFPPDSILDRPRFLFFGGSFDPVHLGHTTLPFAVGEVLWGGGGVGEGEPGGWAVVYVPAGQSPHKDAAPTSAEHRVAMLEIGIGDRSNAGIWMHEIDQPDGPSYWADTWQEVQALLPDAESRFLIGADQAKAMHRWSRYDAFWRDAVVMLRGQDSADELIEAMHATKAWSPAELGEWRSKIVRTDMVDASSTAIRDALGNESKRNTGIEGLDPGVQEYIVKHGLYL